MSLDNRKYFRSNYDKAHQIFLSDCLCILRAQFPQMKGSSPFNELSAYDRYIYLAGTLKNRFYYERSSILFPLRDACTIGLSLRKTFLLNSLSIFTSEIGNKRKMRYTARKFRDYLESQRIYYSQYDAREPKNLRKHE